MAINSSDRRERSFLELCEKTSLTSEFSELAKVQSLYKNLL